MFAKEINKISYCHKLEHNDIADQIALNLPNFVESFKCLEVSIICKENYENAIFWLFLTWFVL